MRSGVQAKDAEHHTVDRQHPEERMQRTFHEVSRDGAVEANDVGGQPCRRDRKQIEQEGTEGQQRGFIF
jgi:hypothetical protein